MLEDGIPELPSSPSYGDNLRSLVTLLRNPDHTYPFPPLFQNQNLSHQLLHHFTTILSPQLVWVDTYSNPWHTMILPLAAASPALLFSILALTAGDLSDRMFGCAHSAADAMYNFTSNRERALALLAKHVRLELEDINHTEPSREICKDREAREPTNHILATVVVLCYQEIKWPSSGVWKVHLRAARTLIRKWARDEFWMAIADSTRSFLMQELFATNVMASITNFDKSEELVVVSLPGNDGAPFTGFLKIIQSITDAERSQNKKRVRAVGDGELEALCDVLARAREHALRIGEMLDFRTSQARLAFGNIIHIFYNAVLIYYYQALTDRAVYQDLIDVALEKLLAFLDALTDKALFAQDLPWPLFLAGTECRGRVDRQEFIELRILETVRISGTLDRLRALAFLKEFWTMSHDEAENWIEMGEQRGKAGDSFLIW